jgi:hypothetical protein
MEITDVLDRCGVPYRTAGSHHHARDGWVQMDCPWCGLGTEKFHLGYALSSGACHCWKCGKHSVREVLVEYLGVSFGKAKELLSGVNETYTAKEINRPKTALIPDGVVGLQKAHRQYLRSRGYDPRVIAAVWGVGGFGPVGPLKHRLYIPIKYKAQTVSWTTRAIGDAGLRYVSASEEEESIGHKSLLYGEDYARGSIIVHEGPLDVWATGMGAVAVCGTGYTSAQVNRLSKYPVRVLCFDSEPVAQERARALADDLSGFAGETYVVTLETGSDAGEAHPDELAELRAHFSI